MALDINYFVFNGQDSRDFGIWITAGGLGAFCGSEADITSYAVAGRDGDVIISNNRRRNKPIPYQIFLNPPEGLTLGEAAMNIRNWLQADTEYHTLRDGYNPGYYRMAAYVESFELSDIALQGGTATLTFTTMPGLYLDPVFVGGKGTVTLVNPTKLRASPVIRLESVSGVVNMLFQSQEDGSKTYTFGKEGKTYENVVVDCENMMIYEEGEPPENLFPTCNFPLEFPSLPVGTTTLTVSGNPQIDVEPRWRSR